MSPVRRFLTLFTVAFLIVWVTLAIVAYDSLPATLATHFGPNGRADGFATKSIGSWFLLTMVGVSTSMLLKFAAIQYDMYRVASTSQRGLSPVTWFTMAIALGGNLIATPIWLFRFRRNLLAAAATVANSARTPRSS